MKLKNLCFLLMIFSVSVFSCGGDDDLPENNESEFFIEGRIDGEMMRAEYICTLPGCELFAGAYDSDFSNGHINFERTMSATDTRGWDIDIYDVGDYDTWQLPAVIDPVAFVGEINMDLSYYSGPWESENNWLMDQSNGDDSFEMIITSKTDDILEGTFSGELRNGSDLDSRVTVTDGRFRVKLTIF